MQLSFSTLAKMDMVMFEEHLTQCHPHPELATGLEIHVFSVRTQ